MKILSESLRAFYAGLSTILAGLAAVLSGSATLGDVTTGQWVVIAGAALTNFAGVWGITNVKKRK